MFYKTPSPCRSSGHCFRIIHSWPKHDVQHSKYVIPQPQSGCRALRSYYLPESITPSLLPSSSHDPHKLPRTSVTARRCHITPFFDPTVPTLPRIHQPLLTSGPTNLHPNRQQIQIQTRRRPTLITRLRRLRPILLVVRRGRLVQTHAGYRSGGGEVFERIVDWLMGEEGVAVCED